MIYSKLQAHISDIQRHDGEEGVGSHDTKYNDTGVKSHLLWFVPHQDEFDVESTRKQGTQRGSAQGANCVENYLDVVDCHGNTNNQNVYDDCVNDEV